MSIARELSEAALRFQYDRIPPEVTREMKRFMLDALACAIGAFELRSLQNLPGFRTR